MTIAENPRSSPKGPSTPTLAPAADFTLSDEQLQIVRHPEGFHGKVLSVAGSGKTTTMACRVKELTANRGVPPQAIQVLMYNRLARRQFRQRLAQVGLPRELQPPVDTFHSYAYRLLNDMADREDWTAHPEQANAGLRQAIQAVIDRHYPPAADADADSRQERRERGEQLTAHLLDPAREAIMLWKNANLPPERAGYDADPATAELYRDIYREFETRRQLANRAVTYDDFLPEALALLEREPARLQAAAGRLRHLIVDEYQDINLAQQQLVELLAGGQADLLVVGDDDQTIYEWRGARADYILGEFQNVFDNKPHRVYKLTHSFRFGYHIAQNAQNVIRHNPTRLSKELLAYRPELPSRVIVCSGGAGRRPNEELADRLEQLLHREQIAPERIRVLGRTHNQLHRFSLELLRRGIPHRALGHTPFLQAAESRDLLNYLQLAAAVHRPPGPETADLLRGVLNRPNRFLSHLDRQAILDQADRERSSLLAAMQAIARPQGRPAALAKLRNLEQLARLLEEVNGRLYPEAGTKPAAAAVLAELLESSRLETHYTRSYGYGEATRQRCLNLQTLLDYAAAGGLDWERFLGHARETDPARGRPEAELVNLMTIHTAKGLEFDYVLLPECAEGAMPTLVSGGDPTFDAREPRRAPQPAEWLENERRLFYVAATRARQALILAGPDPGPEAKPSRFLEEMEPEATAAIAAELTAAMAGRENRLAEVLRQWNDQHSIVRLVKQAYSRDLPPELYQEVAAVQLSRAEKPFGYSRQYDRPHRASRAEREQGLARQIQEYMLQAVMNLPT